MTRNPTFDALAGFRPYELGSRSPRPLVHAVAWASEGWSVYAETHDSGLATTEVRALREAYDADVAARMLADVAHLAPEVGFRVVSNEYSGLIAINFPRLRDLEYCTKDFGKLPATRVIERDSGMAYFIFQRAMAGPQIATGKSIAATQAKLKTSFPLPGTRDASGEIWRYKSGFDFSTPLAYLPRSWLYGLPSSAGAPPTAVPMPGDDGLNRYSTLTRGN